MNWYNFFTQIVIALVAASAAAFVAIERDHWNREKDARIAYLVDAYDKLALAANRPPSSEFSRMIEIAVEKIQLFGTLEEIGLLHAFLADWKKSEAAGQRPRGSLDPLLKALRNRLRAELSLPAVSADRDDIHWIRPEGGAQ